MTRKLVVIGNGMAGMKAVEELISAAPGEFEITVFGAEPYGNYNRILLSPVLCGEKSIDDILINPLSWYDENHIRLFAGEQKTVIKIDRHKKNGLCPRRHCSRIRQAADRHGFKTFDPATSR